MTQRKREILKASVSWTDKTLTVKEEKAFKLLYLRVTELEKKWAGGHVNHWAMVLNQLMVNDKFSNRLTKYLR